MDPFTIAGLIGLVAQLGTSIAGEVMSANERAKKEKLLQETKAKLAKIPPPLLKEISAQVLGPSEAGAVQADPALQGAQMNALSKLKGVEDSGGLTMEDLAVQQKVLGRLGRQESAGRSQIDQQMQARGMGNSGAGLAMQLQNQQGSAERASQQGMDTMGMAQKRALEAILGRGDMAGKMRSQGFNEQFKTGQARDEIARYNAANTDRVNMYNSQLPRQHWQDQMTHEGAMAGQNRELGKFYEDSADDTRQAAAGYGQSFAEMGQLPARYAYAKKKSRNPYEDEKDPFGRA